MNGRQTTAASARDPHRLHRRIHVGAAQDHAEVITLAVFVPLAVFTMGQPLKLDYLWAGLCRVGAVYFIFRG